MENVRVLYFNTVEDMDMFLQIYIEKGKRMSPIAELGSMYKVGERFYVYTKDGMIMLRNEQEIAEDNMKREMMSLLSYYVNKEYKTYDRLTEDEKIKYSGYVNNLLKEMSKHVKTMEFGY